MKAKGVIIISLIMILAAAHAMAAPGTLTFASLAMVQGERISLLDLVHPKAALGPDVEKRLADVHIAKAPRPGKTTYVQGARVRGLLAGSGIPKGTSVLIPAKIEIRRQSGVFTTGDQIEAYMAALEKKIGARAADADIHNLSARSDLNIPAGKVSTRVSFMRNNLTGRVPALVEVMVDGRKVASGRVTGQVDMYGTVVVAARSMGRGHMISYPDLKKARVNLSQANSQYHFRLEDVAGMRTRTAMHPGQPVLAGSLERVAIIKRGDVVNMVCSGPGMKITAKGRAEQSGYRGGMIRLVNLASKRKVYGKVLASGEVLVEF